LLQLLGGRPVNLEQVGEAHHTLDILLPSCSLYHMQMIRPRLFLPSLPHLGLEGWDRKLIRTFTYHRTDYAFSRYVRPTVDALRRFIGRVNSQMLKAGRNLGL
jgi:hypothetical protein